MQHEGQLTESRTGLAIKKHIGAIYPGKGVAMHESVTNILNI
jgi:hypothetical protein